MPFQKKEKASVDLIDPEVTPKILGNESVAAEKKEKKESGVATDIKAKRELYEKTVELEEKDKEIEQLKKEIEAAKNQPKVSSAPDQGVIEQLQAQIDALSRQIRTSDGKGGKLLFRTPTAADLVDEAIVFTARSVIYIVASYVDSRGLEQLPPFKLIVFQYAASDIRKDGREEEIKNFSQYTTNYKPEIDFLRNHPLYGVSFSENTNEMMNEDVKEMQFKERAALQLANASPEDIYNKAKELDLPNWRNKAASELKYTILQKMTNQYKKEAQQLQDDILKRQVLAGMSSKNKE